MEFAIYPFKRYGKYRLYVRFEDHNGNEVDRSTGVTYGLSATKKEKAKAKKEAQKKAKPIVTEYLEKHEESYQEPDENYRLKKFLKDYYFPHIKAHRAEGTFISYERALRNFLRICKDRPLNKYKRFDFNKYKLHRLNNEGIAKTTINIELRSIKAAFSKAHQWDFVNKDIFKGQEQLFDVKPNRREFTKKELNKLFKKTEGEMIGLIIRLAYYTGMRIGELTNITWDMVHLEENYIHLPAEITKNDKSRDVPLGKKAMKIIKALEQEFEKKKERFPKVFEDKSEDQMYVIQKTRGWGKYAIRSVEDLFRKRMNKAGLPKKLKFHCLRHTFATHILEKGGDIYPVSKIMGHTTTQVTQQFYDHTTALNFRKTADLI